YEERCVGGNCENRGCAVYLKKIPLSLSVSLCLSLCVSLSLSLSISVSCSFSLSFSLSRSLSLFFSSRRRHTRFKCDWSSDVCSSDLTHAHTDTDTHTHQHIITHSH